MEYSIVYSKRRTISLCIKAEGLVVRAPYGTSRERIESVIASHRKWIDTHLEKYTQRQENFTSLTDDQIDDLRKFAKSVLPIKAKKYAETMGLNYGRITITSAKTRFGSCSSRGNLSFSYLLMLYPEEAIDYVVVHELAHLKEMNHSPKFYKIIESVMPDYKDRAKLLKK